ncbi:RcnB family protein, partial [Sphingomonas sp. Sphisp140]
PQTQVSPPQAQPQQRWDGNRGGDGRRDWNRNGQDRRDWNRDGNRSGQWDRGNRDWNDRNRDRNNNGWNRGGWGGNDRNRWDNNRGWGGNDRGRWNNGWRNDRRYDWRGYRSSNRGLYRLPRYYAPSGWGYGYRRFGIGFTLSSILFSSQYWINDPYYYRLPEVYGPYRWVRYYNDALLVDVETGEIVDTIYDIFW